MTPVYGQAPVIGFTVTVEELKTDYDLYDTLFKASGGGTTMTAAQKQRYADLKAIFEGQANG